MKVRKLVQYSGIQINAWYGGRQVGGLQFPQALHSTNYDTNYLTPTPANAATPKHSGKPLKYIKYKVEFNFKFSSFKISNFQYKVESKYILTFWVFRL